MCDVIEMTSKLTSLSRSGFNNRLKLMMPNSIANLKTLNRKLELLVEETYDIINEIGEREYEVIKEPLDVLIATVKDLIKAYKKRYSNNPDCEILESRLSCLLELKEDIIRFRLPNPKRKEWEEKVDQLTEALITSQQV